MSKPIINDNQNRKELIVGFVKKMLELTYCEEFIGEQLALIIWALDNPECP